MFVTVYEMMPLTSAKSVSFTLCPFHSFMIVLLVMHTACFWPKKICASLLFLSLVTMVIPGDHSNQSFLSDGLLFISLF